MLCNLQQEDLGTCIEIDTINIILENAILEGHKTLSNQAKSLLWKLELASDAQHQEFKENSVITGIAIYLLND